MSSDATSFLGDEITYELDMAIRVYRSGRVERLVKDDTVPPSLDPDTGVDSKDVMINPATGLSARLYLPPSASSTSGSDRKKLPVLIYYHGGSFSVISTFFAVYHNHLTALTAKADILIVSVNYRLAPENPLPAAYDDSWEALNWVSSHESDDNTGTDPWLANFGNLGKIFLVGDSSGGNIVHHLGLKLGITGTKVEGLILIHPYFWGKERIGNEGTGRKKSMRSVEDVDSLWPIVFPGISGLDDPWVNPLANDAPSLAMLGCRRALICVAELDLLRDRGRAYYEKLMDCGWEGEAEFMETEGEDHVFFLFKPSSTKVAEYRDKLVVFLNKA